MTSMTSLWLPILLSAVIVFIASSLIHMVLGWHKNDYPQMPGEDKFSDAVRPLSIPPGDYFVPRAASHDQMRTPEFAERVKRGPVMVITVLPNKMFTMGKNLSMWFVYLLVVSFFSAYIAAHTLAPHTHYLQVFRVVGAVAFIGYAFALWQNSIWWGRAWGMTIKSTIDGLIYGLLTAGTFGWLWPK